MMEQFLFLTRILARVQNRSLDSESYYFVFYSEYIRRLRLIFCIHLKSALIKPPDLSSGGFSMLKFF